MHNEFDCKIDGVMHLFYLYWVRKRKFVVLTITVLKIGNVRASKSYLLNSSRGSFEEMSLTQSCRELNDVSFEIRLKSLK